MKPLLSPALLKKHLAAMQIEKTQVIQALSHLAHCSQCQLGVVCVAGTAAKKTLTSYGVE